MPDSSTCPSCGAEVPEPMTSSAVGSGDPPAWQPAKQHAACLRCGAELERMKEPGPGHEWKLKR